MTVDLTRSPADTRPREIPLPPATDRAAAAASAAPAYPPVFVISLARSADRRNAIDVQLTRLGIPYTFFDAVDGRAAESDPRAPFPITAYRGRYGIARTATELACFASHYLLWQKCVALGEPILVMEDDLRLGKGFAKAVRLAAEAVGADLVRLCALDERPAARLRALSDDFSLVQFLRGPSGTQAYVIGPRGARKLIAGCDVIRDPVDDYIDRFWHHGAAALAVVPWQAEEVKAPSQIERASPLSGFARLRFKIERELDSYRRRAWLKKNPVPARAESGDAQSVPAGL
jgi:glycosyl transferase family 25